MAGKLRLDRIEYHRPHRGYQPEHRHRHIWHELIVVERGTYRARSAAGEIALRAGQWVCWPAGLPHEPAITATDPQRDAYFFCAWEGDTDLAPPGGVPGIDVQRRLLNAARWLYDASYREPLDRDLLDALLLALVTEAHWLARESASVGDDRLERARHFLLEHLGKDITVSTIAETVGLSVRHFERRFKERYGQTPKRYLLRQREERALDLLVNTDLPLAAIARAVAMPGASYLCRRIRQSTGRTPGNLRSAPDQD